MSTWLHEKLLKHTFSSPTDIFWDDTNKLVWVCSASHVKALEFYSSDAGNEGGTALAPMFYETYGFNVVADLPYGGSSMTNDGTYLYLRDGFNIYQINLSTQSYVTTFSVGDIVISSNLASSSGKLWFVDSFKDPNTQQKLYSLDTSTGVVSAGASIPVTPTAGSTPIAVVGSYVITLNRNYAGVTKFLVSTGAYSASIAVNARPSAIVQQTSTSCYVASYGGMLSRVNLSANSSTNIGGLTNRVIDNLVYDGTYIWSATGGITRYNPASSPTHFISSNLVNPPSIPTSGVLGDGTTTTIGTSHTKLCIAPSFSYSSRTVGPYVFAIYGSGVVGFRTTKAYFRTQYTSVLGTGMITTGTANYAGEA